MREVRRGLVHGGVGLAATLILPGLFLGDAADAVGFTGPRLCVHENPAVMQYRSREEDEWIPILASAEPMVKASVQRLDAAAEWVEQRRLRGESVLVHCHAGVERSPLAMAWYLYRKRGVPWEEAYALVEKLRPVVQRRDSWVPWEERSGWGAQL